MTLEELKQALLLAEKDHAGDWEEMHSAQDELLLAYINDEEITRIFYQTTKWCA